MFDRVTLRATDLAASERFYATVLPTLGIADRADFRLAQADAGHPATRGLHIAFVAPSRAHVDAFWRAGVDGGHRSDGEPGPRPQYRADYYGAFLLDPDGNSAEAVHHGAMRTGGIVDHLWIRVADLAAARRFYEAVAPRAGLRPGSVAPDRVQFRGPVSGSFSLVAGPPTQHVRMAFAGDQATVLADPDGNEIELVDRGRRRDAVLDSLPPPGRG